MILITYLEATRSPLAVYTYNRLEDITAFLTAGTKKESFGPKTDEELSKLPVQDRKKIVNVHPGLEFYKAARVFNPSQAPSLPTDTEEFKAVMPTADGNSDNYQKLVDEFLVYRNLKPEMQDNKLVEFRNARESEEGQCGCQFPAWTWNEISPDTKLF
ncbi:hypothetical protein SNE40_021232 [Patella caerulea]|uniref:Uncharacterized protein n=1 Tax=Patella caerulea TaxID=87958 RepID=A0AAN8IYX1_PATCE